MLFCLIYLGFQDLIVEIYGEQSPLFVEYYLWVIPLTLFYLYYEVLINYLRSLEDTVTGSFTMEILQRVLTILFLLISYFYWITFPVFVILFVVNYIVIHLFIVLRHVCVCI